MARFKSRFFQHFQPTARLRSIFEGSCTNLGENILLRVETLEVLALRAVARPVRPSDRPSIQRLGYKTVPLNVAYGSNSHETKWAVWTVRGIVHGGA